MKERNAQEQHLQDLVAEHARLGPKQTAAALGWSRELVAQTEEGLKAIARIVLGKVGGMQEASSQHVLAYIAFSQEPQLREQRANAARAHFDQYDDQKRAFLDFVLQQYVKPGVEELQPKKLPIILQLKYKTLPDAPRALGDVAQIRDTFIGFHRWLYGGR